MGEALAAQRGDLSLDPRDPCEKASMAACICNLSAGELRWGGGSEMGQIQGAH